MVVHADAKPQTYLDGVQSADIDAYWPLVVDLLTKPLVRMKNDLDYSPEDIREACKEGRMQLWVVHDCDEILCAGVTQISNYPQRKILTALLTGAKPQTMPYWIEHFETIKAFGRAKGCSAVRICGRKGWERAFNPDVIRTEIEVYL